MSCKNDTDGDGDCQYCVNKKSGCYNKDKEEYKALSDNTKEVIKNFCISVVEFDKNYE